MNSTRAFLSAALAILTPAALQAWQQEHTHPSAGHQGHMHRRFDPSSSARFDDPKRDERQKPDEVLAALGLRPSIKVADIGAGTGYFTIRLARHPSAPLVYAVDIEASMLEHIRGRAGKEGLNNVVTVEAKEESPNLPVPVDLVLMVNTYHHIPNRIAYFAGLLKSLTPGGRVAIIDWKPGAQGGPSAHFRFSAGQIQDEMAKAGYRVMAGHGFLPDQTFQIFVPVKAGPGKAED
jgi:SAM-dependent methyltransferase